VKKEVKDRYLTIRLPAIVERSLKKRATADSRTLSGQVLHYVKAGLAEDNSV